MELLNMLKFVIMRW